MKCYSHMEVDAVGICKACNKAVCTTCSTDTGRGISCSEQCTKEIEEQNQIIDKSKQIYSIGSKSVLMPTGLLMHFFFGLVFGGFGLFQTLRNGSPQWFLLVMGIGFLVVGFIGWYRNRNININC